MLPGGLAPQESNEAVGLVLNPIPNACTGCAHREQLLPSLGLGFESEPAV